MRGKEEAKFLTENKKATRKVHLQHKRSEAFDTFINSTNSMSSSTTYGERLIQIIQQPSNIIKDAFVHIGGKLAKPPNQTRDAVAREMIRIMKWRATIK